MLDFSPYNTLIDILFLKGVECFPMATFKLVLHTIVSSNNFVD